MGYSTFDFSEVSILIVDDNRHMRALLCSIVHALGMKRIKEVADGETALKVIDEFSPDIVLTDWHMEPMDGLELVRKIRGSGEESTRYVPIIMLTGHSEVQRVREARDAGIHEFLAKPISAKSLFARIAAIVENPRPFIKSEYYFGPDRRRQDVGPEEGRPDRRKKAGDAEDRRPPQAVPADEIDKLLTT